MNKSLVSLGCSLMLNYIIPGAYAGDDAPDYDPTVNAMYGQEDIGIHFNAPVSLLTDTLETSDKTTFLYVTTTDLSTSRQDWSMLDSMFRTKIAEFGEAYMVTFAYDCQHPATQDLNGTLINHDVCSSDPFQPEFKLFVPPDIRTNPYTGKPMPT